MSAVTEAANAIQAIPTGGDPVLEAAKWVVLVLLMIGGASVPFMMIMNKKNKDRNENTLETAISGAGSTLYNQLIKQVDEYRSIANIAYSERNGLMERVAKLEAGKEDADRIRADLLSRDEDLRKLLAQGAEERAKFLEMLVTKDKEIARRDSRIEQLDRLMKSMEIRLARAEERQVVGGLQCPIAAANEKAVELSLMAGIAVTGGSVSHNDSMEK